MAKKKAKYIIAVKDYEQTVKGIASGAIKMEKGKEVYKHLFDNVVATCDSLDGMMKFIRTNKYNKKDCMHYWEGLLVGGHTLITATYDTEDENFVENLCDNSNLVFISRWMK